VLLFDDVITKGDSMLRFKRKMEELGAIVVGGFSIGKTTHMR
jgi:predicted amidophosphoribosyltransferase